MEETRVGGSTGPPTCGGMDKKTRRVWDREGEEEDQNEADDVLQVGWLLGDEA